jgi:hypothetical protein
MSEEQPNPPHHHGLCAHVFRAPAQCTCKDWDHSECSWCFYGQGWRPADEDIVAMGLNLAQPETWPHHGLCAKFIWKEKSALTCSCRRFWGEERKPRCVAGGCWEARAPSHALCTLHLKEIQCQSKNTASR